MNLSLKISIFHSCISMESYPSNKFLHVLRISILPRDRSSFELVRISSTPIKQSEVNNPLIQKIIGGGGGRMPVISEIRRVM